MVPTVDATTKKYMAIKAYYRVPQRDSNFLSERIVQTTVELRKFSSLEGWSRLQASDDTKPKFWDVVRFSILLKPAVVAGTQRLAPCASPTGVSRPMAWYYGHGGLSSVGYGNNKRLIGQNLNPHLLVSGRPRPDICHYLSQANEPVEDFLPSASSDQAPRSSGLRTPLSMLHRLDLDICKVPINQPPIYRDL